MMLTGAFAQDGKSPAEKLLASPRPLVIAHRGCSELAPENTHPSFKLAKACGADMVELDYHHTQDGQLVVIHDDTLDRTTDAVARWGGAKIPVSSKSLAELKTLDAGKWFDPRFAGTPLPSLAEALDVIQDGGVTLIERKAGDAAACARLLRTRNEVNKVVVQAFDWKYLADFHALEPAQVLGALGPPSHRNGRKLTDEEKVLAPAYLAAALKAGARVVGWNNQVTKAAVDEAHALGLKVWIYTVNKPDEAARLLDLGIDGLITNTPPVIWRTLALRKPPGPQPGTP